MSSIKTKNLISDIASRLEVDQEIKNFESRTIAHHVLDINYAQLLIEREIDLTKKQIDQIDLIITKRNKGIPLAYVINSVAFRELELYVDSRVLIPRSETELLVEMALNSLKDIDKPVVLDIGTGSGAIALSIAHENIDATVIGLDISSQALEVAWLNCAAVGSSASRVNFIQSDLFSELKNNPKFDLIISNPPYVSINEQVYQAVVDHEPHYAVFSDEDGLSHIQRIVENIKYFLKPQGQVFIEIGETQGQRVKELGEKNGLIVKIKKDFSSRDRFALMVLDH